MIWHSATDFLAMGGYGLYVWGSYGLGLVLMGAEPVLAGRRRRQALRMAALHAEPRGGMPINTEGSADIATSSTSTTSTITSTSTSANPGVTSATPATGELTP